MVSERSKVVGARMRKAREARGMSLKEASVYFYVTNSYLGQMERGYRNVTEYAMEKAAEVYGVDIVWLRYGVGGMDDD